MVLLGVPAAAAAAVVAGRIAPPGSIGERLHKAAAEKRARLEQKAAESAHSGVEDCTFTPATNAAANARVLESYEYVPLHKRLGQVSRSFDTLVIACPAAAVLGLVLGVCHGGAHIVVSC